MDVFMGRLRRGVAVVRRTTIALTSRTAIVYEGYII